MGCSTALCSAACGVQQGGWEGCVAPGQGGTCAPRRGPALDSSVQQARYLRHDNHAEVQPVPRVPKEGECVQAEASSQNLDQRLKGVNGSEGVPGEERAAGLLREVEAHRPGWPGPPHGRRLAQPPLSRGPQTRLCNAHSRTGVAGWCFVPNLWLTHPPSHLFIQHY